MGKSEQPLKERSEARHSNVFALAMAMGLIVFFVTVESPGGLSGVQGFLLASPRSCFCFL